MWRSPRSCRRTVMAACIGIVLATCAGIPQAIADALDDVRAGNEFFKAGRLEDAISAYTKAIVSGEMQSETLAITYNNRGVALGESNEFGRAIDDYEKALQLLPGDPTTAKNLRVALIKRGMGLQSAGSLVEAAADFDRAIATQPDHYLGYLRRAELNVVRGNLALAVSDYKLALARKPGDADLIAALNQAREALSRPVDTPLSAEADSTTQPDSTPASSAQATTSPAVSTQTNPVNTSPPSADQDVADDVTSEPPVNATPAPTTAAEESSARSADQVPVAATDSRSSPDSIEPGAGAELMITLGAVNVRDSPANSGALVTTVAEGVVLPVLGEELGWKRVRLSDGGEGYIYRRWLEPAPPQ